MKDWQQGYELDYLKSVEALYSDYNKFSLSPFAEYKKNNIAADLHEGKLILEDEGSYVITEAKVTSPITLYQNVEIGYKLSGDKIITKLRGTSDFIEKVLFNCGGNVWCYCWAEDKETKKYLNKYFKYVGSKITTFGEIYAIYFKGERTHPYIDPVEHIGLKQVGICNVDLIESIRSKLETLNLNFKNHYSNYNKKNAWSALSLRGYYSDISRIEKPIEMSKKWKEEHKDEEFYLQDTVLRNEFPEVDELLRDFDGNMHRIRFMRLTPGGGELERHTDQVDPDSGGTLGKLARIHFPIKTNPDVKFTVWDLTGDAKTDNMRVGEYWFLDTRKPHRAINGGNEERIHLVIDVEVTEGIKDMILHG